MPPRCIYIAKFCEIYIFWVEVPPLHWWRWNIAWRSPPYCLTTCLVAVVQLELATHLLDLDTSTNVFFRADFRVPCAHFAVSNISPVLFGCWLVCCLFAVAFGCFLSESALKHIFVWRIVTRWCLITVPGVLFMFHFRRLYRMTILRATFSVLSIFAIHELYEE